MRSVVLAIPFFLSAADRAWSQSPFAIRVVSYDPAPGQFVQQTAFNDPARALGAPRGGTLSVADNTSVVSLGGLGGSISLAFDHTVEDHPLNPYGMDAIVFGNAFHLGGDLRQRWAEAGTIEISRDDNGNGLSDDPWYLIPGSHIDVTKTDFLIVTWDTNTLDSTFPPALSSWLPQGAIGMWETGNYALPPDRFGRFVVVNPSADPNVEGIFGYADYSVTLGLSDLNGDGSIDDPSITEEAFYTTPDHPLTAGVTRGSGGGDAFDIAWAVDPNTGEPARLSGFDFIRITTAVAAVDPIIGEISTEVDAVADVAPDFFSDADGDRDIDLADVGLWLACYRSMSPADSPCDALGRDGVEELDILTILGRLTGPLGGAG